jgi:hypothetical protein
MDGQPSVSIDQTLRGLENWISFYPSSPERGMGVPIEVRILLSAVSVSMLALNSGKRDELGAKNAICIPIIGHYDWHDACGQ